MNYTIQELERKLKEAKLTEQLKSTRCASCGGEGYYSDTTYDRTGAETYCSVCYGTGLSRDKVNSLIEQTFKPYRKK